MVTGCDSREEWWEVVQVGEDGERWWEWGRMVKGFMSVGGWCEVMTVGEGGKGYGSGGGLGVVRVGKNGVGLLDCWRVKRGCESLIW